MPYFDHNATTPLLPQAREAWLAAMDEAWQNPSSPYRSAARAHRLLEENRSKLAAMFGAPPENIVFNSGASEGNNAILAWAAAVLPADRGACVPPTEHPSMLEAARAYFAGPRLRSIEVDASGRIVFEKLEAALRREPAGLVAAMAANNETGVLGDAAAHAALCREQGAWMLCDGSQWIGKLPCAKLPRDIFLVGCAHKFGGPKGAGFICLPPGAEGFRGIRGGGHEHGHRAGTENLASIAAMVAALVYSESHDDGDRRARAGWRDACAAAVIASVPGAFAHGADAPRLWNTLSLCLPAHENTRWVARLDRLGFDVSTGSACATGSDAPSHVLAAMGVFPEQARRTIRISSGWATTQEDWLALAAAIAATWRELEAENSGGAVIQV